MTQLGRILMIVGVVAALGCNSSKPSTAPANLEVVPDQVAVAAGESARLAVVDDVGDPVAGPVTWRSSNPMVVGVDGSGMVTGGYGPGSATVSAQVRGVVATAEVGVLSPCASPVVPQGDPDPQAVAQRFDVGFDPGVDGLTRARELADAYGFVLERVANDGFTATLSPAQASGVGCAAGVASLTYL